jgi:hypothetical protein
MLRRVLIVVLLALPPQAAGQALQLEAPLRDALERLRSGRYRETVATARGLEHQFPAHPLPPLMEAEAYAGLIFCQTGHINSREIWHSAETKTTAFDEAFFSAVERAVERGEAMREVPETAALGAFYQGLAHGVGARIHTLRGEALRSGRQGKEMRAALLEAVEQDASLQADAQVGLGVYNYYADVMSPLIKLFRFFLMIPGGDREAGLEQLRTASQQAALLEPEARLELARILGLRENQPVEALTLLRELSDQYQENALHALMAAIQAERIGEKPVAAEYARRAAASANEMDDVCRSRLQPVADEALLRLEDHR